MTISFRRVGFGVLVALILLSASSHAKAGAATQTARMTIGDPQVGHIDIAVATTRGVAHSIAVHLHRVGAAGSRFTLAIGGHPVVPPFILSEAQCRFDSGGSLCDLTIGPKDRAFRPLLAAFRSGRQARVTVENAGNIAMSRAVSLRPLSRPAT